MTTQYWLVKSEPSAYAWADLVRDRRTAWTGVITVRAAVWRNNYPTANRAKIAGKLATIQSITLALSGLGVGLAMDASPDNYHYLFPVLALFGLIGNQIYRKVRLRRARQLQRAELDGRKKDAGFSPMGMVTLLREDRLYASFMWWMSVFGFGNLMLMAPMTFVVTDEFRLDYTQGILVNAIINAFRTVDHIFVMTHGGPDNATNVLLLMIYDTGFKFWDQGAATALTVVLLGVLSSLALIQFLFARRRVHYQ
jgi:hypothetical protein